MRAWAGWKTGALCACLLAPIPASGATAPATVESLNAGLCASEYPSDSIAWAAECLVKAIRAEDRRALLTLTADPVFLPCLDTPCQHDFIWGEAPWPGAARKTLSGVLANADNVEFIFYGDGGEAAPLRSIPLGSGRGRWP
jgi:hypothetical protein